MLFSQGFAIGDNLNNPFGYNLLKCPLCETPIEGNEEELVNHVQKCLKKVLLYIVDGIHIMLQCTKCLIL